MKVVLGIALAFVVGLPALGAGITTVEINGIEYTNVNNVRISDNGRIFVSSANGLTVVSADKLPEDFLKSWNKSQNLQKRPRNRKRMNCSIKLSLRFFPRGKWCGL